MKEKINGCDKTEDLRCSELEAEINQSLVFIANINKILNADCKKKRFVFLPEKAVGLVDLSYNIKEDNLKANNWYYGTIT